MSEAGFQRGPGRHSGHRCRTAVAITLAVGVAVGALGAREARACSASGPTTAFSTLPRTGATEVSTASSFVIASGVAPTELVLKAGDVDVPLKPPTLIGPGYQPKLGLYVTYWKVETASGFLPASADLVLSAAGSQGGPRVVLTSIKTAAGYDKQPGMPATLKSLKLTRVRYPISEIAAGGCVFAEYMGYISFESDVATFPGTPADSVVNTIVLRPKNGGAAEQALTYDGSEVYMGSPAGDVGRPGFGWMPHLDPTLEYCASIRSFGVGDLARLPVTSNVVCVRVDEVSSSAAGATPDAGAPDAPGAASPDAAATADAATPDVGSPPVIPSSGGCAVAGGAPSTPGLVLLALAGLVSRRRLSGGRSARRS